MKRLYPFVSFTFAATITLAEAHAQSQDGNSKFLGFANTMTVVPTDMLDMPAAPRVEFGTNLERGTLKAKTEESNVTVKQQDESIHLTPSIALADSAFFSLELERSWLKSEYDASVLYDGNWINVDGTNTGKFLSANPQFAYKINENFGFGVGYEYFREDLSDEDFGSYNLNYGRPHVSARFAMQQIKLDLGLKSSVSRTEEMSKTEQDGEFSYQTTRLDEHRYLPNEVLAKISYTAADNLDFALMLHFFDYNRKEHEETYFRTVKLQDSDRLSLALATAYRPNTWLTLQGILKHDAAVDTKASNAGISTNGVELNTIFHLTSSFDVGTKLAYAAGNDKLKYDDGSESPKLNANQDEVGVWLASRF